LGLQLDGLGGRVRNQGQGYLNGVWDFSSANQQSVLVVKELDWVLWLEWGD